MFGITNREDRHLVLDFEKTMEHIVASIHAAGFDPYAQLYGYLKTGDETYITRTGDARRMIKTFDCEQLRQFVDQRLVSK